jgi:hypothetical protein
MRSCHLPIPALALLATALLGCGDKGDKDDTATAFTLVLEDAANYAYSASYTTEPIPVQDCPEDLTVDWSGLTTDLLGQPLEPTTDLDTIRVVAFQDLGVEDVLEDIAADDLHQADLAGNVDHEITAGETSAEIASGFSFNGAYVEPSTEFCASLGRSYMVTAMSGLYDYRMFGFFVPTDGETNTTVSLTADTTSISIEVDLERGGIVPVPGDQDVVVDWSGLTTDMRGNPLSLSHIDRFMLGRFDLTIPEIEASFLQLEELAVELYTAEASDGVYTLDLSQATDASGGAFAGFGDAGPWLLALSCSTCATPAPYYLAVLGVE